MNDGIISIRKIPATNSIPPTPLIKGGKGGSLIPKFKGNDIIAFFNLFAKILSGKLFV
jgi:hypothetical protein